MQSDIILIYLVYLVKLNVWPHEILKQATAWSRIEFGYHWITCQVLWVQVKRLGMGIIENKFERQVGSLILKDLM